MMNPKKISGLKQVIGKYKTYFFDIDGVLWKGQKAIQGSVQTMQMLRKQNKRIFFITNASIKSRTGLLQKLHRLKYQAKIEQCYPSSYFSALYIKQKYPQIKKLMVFGTKQMAAQIQSHGFEVRHVIDLPQAKMPIQLAQNYLDLSVQAIVVGWDYQMTFAKQCYICFHIQNGIKFFGTNPDKYTSIGGYKVPGCGSILASIEMGCKTKAEIIGKPNTYVLQQIMAANNLNKQECLMIGDNRETDITFGNNAGIDTLCVLSGVTIEQDLIDEKKLKQFAIPTYYSKNIFE